MVLPARGNSTHHSISRECRLLPLLMMAMLFILSSIPGTPGPDGFWLATALEPRLQNALHLPLYATLQILWLRALIKPGRGLLFAFYLALTLTCGYGILDELHQAFVPGRYASVLDVLLNLLGGLLGAALYWLFSTKKRTGTYGTLI